MEANTTKTVFENVLSQIIHELQEIKDFKPNITLLEDKYFPDKSKENLILQGRIIAIREASRVLNNTIQSKF